MKKNNFLFFALFLFTSNLFSQTNSAFELNIKFKESSNTIIDSFNKKIILYKSNEDNGNWEIKNIAETKQNKYVITLPAPNIDDKYKIEIILTGYNPKNVYFNIDKRSLGSYVVLDDVYLEAINLNELKTVTVLGVSKKFIKTELNKTTFQINGNDLLADRDLFSTISMLPGLSTSINGILQFNGKPSEVWIDGIPSGLKSSDLQSYLESFPSNSIERIEIIENPSSSYDATTNGSIINIITSTKANKLISGLFNTAYARSKYDRHTINLSLNGRLKRLKWFVSLAYDDRKDFEEKQYEYTLSDTPDVSLHSNYENTRGATPIFFRINTNYYLNKNTTITLSNIFFKSDLKNNVFGKTFVDYNSPLNTSKNNINSNNINNNSTITLNHKNDKNKSDLSLTLNMINSNNNNTNNIVEELIPNYSISKLAMDYNSFFAKIDYKIPIFNFLDLKIGSKIFYSDYHSNGWYNLTNNTNAIFNEQSYNSVISYKLKEKSQAYYVELEKKWDNLSLFAGLRLETINQKSFSLERTIDLVNNYNNLFPSAGFKFSFLKDVSLSSTYSRKITTPSFYELDPNRNSYYDSFFSSEGNAFLSPNYLDYLDTKIIYLNFLTLGYNYKHSKKDNFIVIQKSDNGAISQTFKTIENINEHNFYINFPVPFSIFKYGFSSLKSFNTNNYLLIGAAYEFYNIRANGEFSPLFSLTANSQFSLPLRLKCGMNLKFFTKGNYEIYYVNESSFKLDLSLSKSFMKDKLKISLQANDIFKDNKIVALYSNEDLKTNYSFIPYSQSFRISFTYKFGLNNKASERNDSDTIDQLNNTKEIGQKE
jgi:hypothetical protein